MAEYLGEEDMNTGEYISRDLALRQLNATCLATDCDNYNGVRCRVCAYADAMDSIDAIPAADVQPVKHGNWEYEDTIGGMKHYHCTNCDNNGSACIADENQILWWEFCPRCGARMDGDVE